MKKSLLFVVCCFLSFHLLKAQDPNFHIYLCFGQSNMEGQGPIESQDRNPAVDPRFQVMQAVNCTNQPAGKWRTASAPIARCNTNIGPTDYFGRTMVANLPTNIKVGVVHVSVAGCKIELFDKATYASYAAGEQQWMKNIIAEYGGNPYAKLIELAKLAQKDGVIKGILLHQGESNAGDQQWPNKVKKVYNDMLTDLGLTAANVPLLAGQVVDAAQGGQTAGMNTIINSLPNTIPTAHVISSAGCTDQSDNLHFTTAGYRLLGKRYADMMLSLLPPVNTDAPPVISKDLSNVTLSEGQKLQLTITASGSNLSYKWYKNSQLILGTGTATLTSPSVSFDNDGDKYYVVVSNNFGTVTSKTITLSVTDFLGVKFLKTPTPITIDGIAEGIWDEAFEYELTHKILTVDNAKDLSAKVKVLYDDQSLYFLYNVVDDVKRASSTNFWENDGIEIYIDGNNDKATSYDANDFQFIVRYDASTILEGHDKSTVGIQAKSTENNTGYVMEVKIPWTTVGVSPSTGKQLGVDFHVNDSDAALRDGKITWFATEDLSYDNPSTFGVGRLENTLITSNSSLIKSGTLEYYPNPTTSVLNFNRACEWKLFNSLGTLINKGEGESIDLSATPLGIYFLQSEGQMLKVIKE